MRNEKTRIIVEAALIIALAAVLNMLKVWQMPQGGNVSFVMLPLIVLALRRGLVVGLVAGVIYGGVDLMLGGYVVHPVQLLLDYPVAFGLVGLAGLMHPVWRRAVASGKLASATWTAVLPAAALAVVGRYASHFASGMVFFGEYAPEGQAVWAYSAAYNLYVPVSGALAFVAAVAILPVLENVLPSSRAARPAAEDPAEGA